MSRPLIKINILTLNTVKPAYIGTSAAGGFRFKQVFESFILRNVKVFR
jgi:hypothetical protein